MVVARVVLFLFIINLGIVFGGGLYASTIVLPQWLSVGPDGLRHWNSDVALNDNAGERMWAFTTTVALTMLAVLNLWVALKKCEGLLRRWWLTGAALALADRVMTILYFIPVMVSLMGSSDTPEAVNWAQRWMNLNYIRLVLELGAWLAALRTFALAQKVRRRSPAYYESKD